MRMCEPFHIELEDFEIVVLLKHDECKLRDRGCNIGLRYLLVSLVVLTISLIAHRIQHEERAVSHIPMRG